MEAIAKLSNSPISPRKMRLVANLIRGMSATKALTVLKYQPKQGAAYLEKLLLSAIANWQHKNEETKLEEAEVYIKEIRVDSAGMLKRIKPAPQGRAHRIRKRANHVTLVVDGRHQPKQASTTDVKEGRGITQQKEQDHNGTES